MGTNQPSAQWTPPPPPPPLRTMCSYAHHFLPGLFGAMAWYQNEKQSPPEVVASNISLYRVAVSHGYIWFPFEYI